REFRRGLFRSVLEREPPQGQPLQLLTLRGLALEALVTPASPATGRVDGAAPLAPAPGGSGADQAASDSPTGTDTGTETPDGGTGATGVGTETPADGPAEPPSGPGFDPSHADPARLAEVVGDEVRSEERRVGKEGGRS